MKAKVLKHFKDKHTGEFYPKGATLTVSKERFEEILTVGPFVEAVKTGKSKEEKENENG